MEKIIEIEEFPSLRSIFGVEDKQLKLLEEEFDVSISINPRGLSIKGKKENVEKVIHYINKIMELDKTGLTLSGEELKEYIHSGVHRKETEEKEWEIRVPSIRKNLVITKTRGQKDYITAIRNYDIVFSIGPAGTGKTYLAMAMAVNFLVQKRVRRIILTRPAVSAGESLGFLPGTMQEKLDPYLRPLYDALYDMIEADVIEDYLETGIIEIVPLAYMRGRTLNNAFVILDEAQNCTSEQLKMFLTRLGFDSKTVITGDITQSDLPGGKPLGLLEALRILKSIKGIKIIQLSKKDVVRHPLIQKIIQAYEDFCRQEGI